ncbi:hypothetical protein PYW07_003199 [Mythimna separata]|uniref:NEDD4-binding protein 2 n=1 Tax=Mythimna separata TaxID=271217 RepID=A0AAD7YHN4_MYTSE|nr:hypothetical protein PYW07_003199 [Mythimna separata]
MESRGEEESNYDNVIENLMNMFGNVMSKEVISAVVESCEGDLNLSVDAIMNITNDGNVITEEEAAGATNQNIESTKTTQASATNMLTQLSITSPPFEPSTNKEPVKLSTDSRPFQPSITNQPVQPTTSYAAFAAQPTQSTGAIPKTTQKPTQNYSGFWTDQVKEIITDHNQGNRTLILMRGVPGSGKSYLARQLVDMMVGASPNNYKTHILTTDDYFMVRGQYQYDKYKLSDAHSWNHNRARNAITSGLSPVIIDNTNIELWEMEPYLKEGVKNGYIIQVVEAKTPWAKKASQLARKNVHNVPMVNIKRMLDNYRDGVTGNILRQTYGLAYPADMVPPVKRTIPPIIKEEPEPKVTIRKDEPEPKVTIRKDEPEPKVTIRKDEPETKATIFKDDSVNSSKPDTNNQFFRFSTSTVNATQQVPPTVSSPEQLNDFSNLNPQVDIKEEKKESFIVDGNDDLTDEEQVKLKLFIEAQKKLEEIEKVEKEWDNGDNWDDEGSVKGSTPKETSKKPVITYIPITLTDAKPQRKSQISPPVTPAQKSAGCLMKNVNECEDWSKISMYMPSWDDSAPATSVVNQEIPIETVSCGTCMEIGDTNVSGKYKVISATPRNINAFHVSFDREKIPQKRMFDKSSMTNEVMITNAYRCPNEEKHFIAFRKLFKNIARSDLRDIFDKCCGDVNWSVEIVLDGMSNNQFKTVDTEDLSDPEEESMEQCACLANYDIIPDVVTPSQDVVKTPPIEEKLSVAANGFQSQKKKRDVPMSQENIEIKRQIEQNVVIADNHYSKHCLKIRKMRRGELDAFEDNIEEIVTSGLSAEAPPFESSYCNNLDLSDDEDCSVSDIDDDVIVTINLGSAFIAELDEKFGREDMQYPDYIVPRISIPMSRLNEINALWMESLTFQLDEHAKHTAEMMQQDEEFARQLSSKEEEMLLAGKEPEVPDFKEIMDMDMALAIYQKDVAEWRNNMPTDMAAKMTRDKLYNLFPDVEKETLTELLMAHDNNFNSTVEVLLMSTGRNDVLEQENGINKFVLSEEMKIKDKIMEEKKKELCETEWPLLSKGGQKVDMATVDAYREEADNHLARRNLNHQKAQDCVRRGMTQVATYYSELANFHKRKYEYANSLAVASLMQFHAKNNPDCTTIDLHYLRVKEAKESLDIFIDTHISKLRDSGVRRNQMLFFITGRGSHSQGRARIKPATIERLKQRGLGYSLKNPGLLAAKVNVDTKLTYQVSVP